jgi:hypothetical protein
MQQIGKWDGGKKKSSSNKCMVRERTSGLRPSPLRRARSELLRSSSLHEPLNSLTLRRFLPLTHEAKQKTGHSARFFAWCANATLDGTLSVTVLW